MPDVIHQPRRFRPPLTRDDLEILERVFGIVATDCFPRRASLWRRIIGRLHA